ncbi:MAG: peptidoglycan-binding domain-containing protein [Cyanobacteriota bacterium]|nr:peptidoglycan-binding domain-containing protein [Cyanobacteriota bacterium]
MKLQEFYSQKLEYGLEIVAADKELAAHIQEILIWHKLLAPPADGKFGPISASALREFQELMKCNEEGFLGLDTANKLIETHPDVTSGLLEKKLNLSNDLASRIIKYMLFKGYHVDRKVGEYNIIYIEGMNPNGILNSDKSNHFNDLRLVIQIVSRTPKIIGIWEATTEPGKHYTYNPMNSKGAARIKFGQYKAWRVGTHGIGKAEPHDGLVQVANVTVHRDFNKDMIRTGDKLDTGRFYINQHHGYDYPRNDIYLAGAGCLVGRTRKGHREFMRLIKQDWRYQSSRNYKFMTAIIAGDDLLQQFPA